MQPIRTNNDAEGWHNRINGRAGKGGLNMYLLVQLLYAEGIQVKLQVTLLCQDTLTRRLKRNVHELQGNLFHLWDLYSNKSIVTETLLENCATLYIEYNSFNF